MKTSLNIKAYKDWLAKITKMHGKLSSIVEMLPIGGKIQ